MPTKLYCYADESGQETRGKVFVVSLVVAEQDKDLFATLCQQFEQASGKGTLKWIKAGYKRKLDFAGMILREPCFKGHLFFAVFHDTREFHEATINATACALRRWQGRDYTAMVVIDALPRSLETSTALELRRAGIAVDKVRGLPDHREPLLRLADSICGLVRLAQNGDENTQELLHWALTTGAIVDLSG
ncbi:MAG: DUF3800 domain-containing protein [Chloroflexota bacterium]